MTSSYRFEPETDFHQEHPAMDRLVLPLGTVHGSGSHTVASGSAYPCEPQSDNLHKQSHKKTAPRYGRFLPRPTPNRDAEQDLSNRDSRHPLLVSPRSRHCSAARIPDLRGTKCPEARSRTHCFGYLACID